MCSRIDVAEFAGIFTYTPYVRIEGALKGMDDVGGTS
jgi:hypothetical protein